MKGNEIKIKKQNNATFHSDASVLPFSKTFPGFPQKNANEERMYKKRVHSHNRTPHLDISM